MLLEINLHLINGHQAMYGRSAVSYCAHFPSFTHHQVDEIWCEGVLNGVRGLFPHNFVYLRPSSSTNKSTAPTQAVIVLATPPVEQPPSISRGRNYTPMEVYIILPVD